MGHYHGGEENGSCDPKDHQGELEDLKRVIKDSWGRGRFYTLVRVGKIPLSGEFPVCIR